jgi:hypothetical protein
MAEPVLDRMWQAPLAHFTPITFSPCSAVGTDKDGHAQDSTTITLFSIQDLRSGEVLAAAAAPRVGVPVVYGNRSDDSNAAIVQVEFFQEGRQQTVKRTKGGTVGTVTTCLRSCDHACRYVPMPTLPRPQPGCQTLALQWTCGISCAPC